MEHRHITNVDWTLDAIDSTIERGDLPDWRELFSAARSDKRIADGILVISENRDHGGASVLAHALAIRLWPDLTGRKLT